jgi:thiol:disulfide interchange protein DsbD
MIPVTIAAFRANRVSRARAFARALAYVAGIAATYSLLGAWAASTGQIFGAALADPRVTGAFALLFALLAAMSFGWLPAAERALARTPAWALRLGGSSAGGAFAMGLVAGIVFAPCVGPVVAGTLAYVATTRDVPFGALVLGTVALGIGTPFAALAMASGELSRLPRAGRVPELVRLLLGLMLLGASLYFASLLLSPSALVGVAAVALAGVGLDRIVRAERSAPLASRAVGLTLLLAAGLVAARFGAAPAASPAPLAWRSDVEPALAEARASGRFAVVDFTADWCLACHELDRVTFQDPEVASLLAAAVRIRVDATRVSESIEALFARFGVFGLPAVVVLDPAGRVVEEARIASFIPPADAALLLRRAGLRAEGAQPSDGELREEST